MKFQRESEAETLLEYDGDQTRVRKTTAVDETLYFGDYERVTHLAAPSSILHRYAVWSDERIVAIVTQKNFQPAGVPGSRAYFHVDHLGSTEKVTDAAGAILERRSYDAFGARRNPDWTQKTLSTASRGTTVGYTGHEDEDDLGLVNMKGRIFDPRLARFLTTDPLVARPGFSQSWNPYSYVMNSPLKYVDPTGFEPDPELVKIYGPGVEDTIEVIGARIPDRDPSVDGRPPRDSDEVNRDTGARDAGQPVSDVAPRQAEDSTGAIVAGAGALALPSAGALAGGAIPATPGIVTGTLGASSVGAVFAPVTAFLGITLYSQGTIVNGADELAMLAASKLGSDHKTKAGTGITTIPMPADKQQRWFVVRVQAQGSGLEKSVPLRQTTPVTIAQGLAALAALQAQLTPAELNLRNVALVKAAEWIQGCAVYGCGPEGKSGFTNPGVSAKDARVDVEIKMGVNFSK